MYNLQHFKRMSATTQNKAIELIETDKVELVKKTSAPAKNRASYITEAFDAIALVEGFPLTTDELWEYFDKATKSKVIKIRKLSEKNPEKTAENGPKKISGHNLFIKEFKEKGPKGVTVMAHRNSIWNTLSEEEHDEWSERANERNKSNGYEPTVKKVTHEQLIGAYFDTFEKWVTEDPETRGSKPERPEKKKKKKTDSSDGSEVSD